MSDQNYEMTFSAIDKLFWMNQDGIGVRLVVSHICLENILVQS